MKKVKFLYNPYSGDRSISSKLDDIFYRYQCGGYLVVPYRIGNGFDIKDGLADINDNYDYILIAGGDGTIDILVNYLKKNNIDIPIAVLPTGTANDFANNLGIPLNINQALDNILKNDVKTIDLGRVNDDYFVNIASSGMFTDVSQKIDTNLKNTMGRMSYIIKGFEEAINLRKFTISVKSKEMNYEGDMYLIIVLNGTTAGNINLAHHSQIDDGLLDVIIFKAMPLPKTVPLLINLLKGAPIDTHNEIIYFKTKELFIDCTENIATDIDGEEGPSFPLYIKCEPRGLKMLGI